MYMGIRFHEEKGSVMAVTEKHHYKRKDCRSSFFRDFQIYISESSIRTNPGKFHSIKLMNLFLAGLVFSFSGLLLIVIFAVFLKTPFFMKLDEVQKELSAENQSALSLYSRLGDIHRQIERLTIKERKIALILGHGANFNGALLGLGGSDSWMSPSDMMVKFSGNGVFRHLARVLVDEHLQLLDREADLTHLAKSISREKERWLRIPSIHPVRGVETSPFGWRNSPFGYGREFHPGIDYAGKMGTPVIATAGGVVIWVGRDSGFGKTVKIRHVDGIVTLFAHLSQYFVHIGEVVTRGQVIAALGNTGMSTGPHLHYEILVHAKPVDPLHYFIVDSFPSVRVAMNHRR